MPRLNDIEQKYIDRLIEFANQHPDYGSASDVWKAINQADPDNQRHIHTRWLLERTLSDNPKKRLLWEDIATGSNSKAHDILKRFLTIRPMLPHDQRNLYRYGNLADVTEVIRTLECVKTPGELKSEERKRVDRNTEVLYEGHGYKIVVPMSEESSCYWGRGTEWCTAATKSENLFHSYHKNGPLVICILPDGHKVQFHKRCSPMDENDSELKDITNPVLVQLCVYFGRLGSINEALRDRGMCLEAIKQEGEELQYVPPALRDREMCLESVKSYGLALEYVSKELRDREMCIEAIKSNGWALHYVPPALRDRELCLESVKERGTSLQYVPEELRDKEMCLEAVKQSGWALSFVPEELCNRELCLEAVKQNGCSLQHVPKDLRDKDMCFKAVKQNGRSLYYVPDRLINKELCDEAVKQNGCSLQHVPKDLRDKDMCFKAVKQNGRSLYYVPDRLINKELCDEAVTHNGWALLYVPLDFIDREMCLEAVIQDGKSLRHVPKELRDREMSLESVKQNGLALQYVPEELRDREICLEAVKSNASALYYVPEELKEYASSYCNSSHVDNIEWIETSLLDDMTQYLQKSCSFSKLSPKM